MQNPLNCSIREQLYKKEKFSFTSDIVQSVGIFIFNICFFSFYFCLSARGCTSRTHCYRTDQESKVLYRNVAREIADQGLVLPPPYYATSKSQNLHTVATLSVPSFKKKILEKGLILGGGTYLTWKIWQHFWYSWPQMPERFYNQIDTVIKNRNGHLDHVPIIQEAFTEFLNSPPHRRAVKHKISQIMINPQQFLEHLEMFYFSPLKWIEVLDQKTTTITTILTHSNRPQTQLHFRSSEVDNLVQEFDQYFADLNTNCEGTLTYETIEKFKYTENQDIRDYILDFENTPLHDLAENFQGEQGLFNFLLRRLMFKFWCGAWIISFRSGTLY